LFLLSYISEGIKEEEEKNCSESQWHFLQHPVILIYRSE